MGADINKAAVDWGKWRSGLRKGGESCLSGWGDAWMTKTTSSQTWLDPQSAASRPDTVYGPSIRVSIAHCVVALFLLTLPASQGGRSLGFIGPLPGTF